MIRVGLDRGICHVSPNHLPDIVLSGSNECWRIGDGGFWLVNNDMGSRLDLIAKTTRTVTVGVHMGLLFRLGDSN